MPVHAHSHVRNIPRFEEVSLEECSLGEEVYPQMVLETVECKLTSPGNHSASSLERAAWGVKNRKKLRRAGSGRCIYIGQSRP